ncbi:MAG: hypothetical protein ACOYVD_15660 [Bacillota bacterium]
MEGLRCPVCKAVSIVEPIIDGEIFSCPFCEHRFTVTSIRRYFMYPHNKNKEQMDLINFDVFLKELEPAQLLLIAQKSLREIEKRM